MPQPVFYDPRKARWKRLRRVFDALAVFFMLLVIFFIYNALHGEPLPKLLWKTRSQALSCTCARRRTRRRVSGASWPPPSAGTKRTRTLHNSNSTPRKASVPLFTWLGMLPASLPCVNTHTRSTCFTLNGCTCSPLMAGCKPSTKTTASFSRSWRVPLSIPSTSRVMPFLKTEDTGMEVFPMVNNSDGTNWVDISAFLNDPGARAHFRQQITRVSCHRQVPRSDGGLRGIPQEGPTRLRRSARELSGALHAKGMKLYVSVQPHNQDFNYPAIAAAADGVVVMDYDEHFPGGQPGPSLLKTGSPRTCKSPGEPSLPTSSSAPLATTAMTGPSATARASCRTA